MTIESAMTLIAGGATGQQYAGLAELLPLWTIEGGAANSGHAVLNFGERGMTHASVMRWQQEQPQKQHLF